MVCPGASPGGAPTATTATAPTSPSASTIRSVLMSRYLLGAKSGRNVNMSCGRGPSIPALTPPHRVQWHPGALDPERPREDAPHLAPDHREGWAAAAPPDRIEAREEPAAGP